MSENLKISKNELIRANTVKNTVGPAVETLAKVDSSELGLSLNESKVIAQAVGILSKLVDDAQAVIDAGEKQYQNRDTGLINSASNRLFRIQSDVSECKAHQNRAQQAFSEKVTDLRQRGYSTREIKDLVDRPEPEIEALQARIDALVAEKAKVEAFLADAPRFDTALLAGTTIEVEGLETEAA